jgi:hypothetical protein
MPKLLFPIVDDATHHGLLEYCARKGVKIEDAAADGITLFVNALARADDYAIDILLDNLLAKRRKKLPEVLED